MPTLDAVRVALQPAAYLPDGGGDALGVIG